MTEPLSNPAAYRAPGRPGTSASHILAAADAILREHKIAPTVRLVAQHAGASATTVAPVLKEWWQSLGARLAAGPAALQRIPEGAVHILEALFLQLKDDAREQLLTEQQTKREKFDQARLNLEVRSHVLTLREGELDSRLRDRERALARLEERLQAVLTLLAKEQASHTAAVRRIEQLEADLAAAQRLTLSASRTPRAARGRPTTQRGTRPGKAQPVRLRARKKGQGRMRSKLLIRPKRAK